MYPLFHVSVTPLTHNYLNQIQPDITTAVEDITRERYTQTRYRERIGIGIGRGRDMVEGMGYRYGYREGMG